MSRTRSLIEHITLAADIHDVGKVAVPDAVLRKPGRLTAEDTSYDFTVPAGISASRNARGQKPSEYSWSSTGSPHSGAPPPLTAT